MRNRYLNRRLFLLRCLHGSALCNRLLHRSSPDSHVVWIAGDLSMGSKRNNHSPGRRLFLLSRFRGDALRNRLLQRSSPGGDVLWVTGDLGTVR